MGCDCLIQVGKSWLDLDRWYCFNTAITPIQPRILMSKSKAISCIKDLQNNVKENTKHWGDRQQEFIDSYTFWYKEAVDFIDKNEGEVSFYADYMEEWESIKYEDVDEKE